MPFDRESFDIIVAISLFTHMRKADTEIYLREIYRLLRPGGRASITAFVGNDPDIPDVQENPEGYPPNAPNKRGPLHTVCFSSPVMLGMTNDAGFTSLRWGHGRFWNFQTEMGLGKGVRGTFDA